jgi:hypothetical protein
LSLYRLFYNSFEGVIIAFLSADETFPLLIFDVFAAAPVVADAF